MPKKYSLEDHINKYRNKFGNQAIFDDKKFEIFLSELIVCGPYKTNLFWNFVKESSKFVSLDDIIVRFLEYYNICGKVTKEKMILKFGHTEGTIRWNIYVNKQAETNTFEYKNKKYGMCEEDFKTFNKNRAVTLDLCIKRHGQISGEEIFKNYKVKQSYAGNKLEYFVEKYGEEFGEKKYIEVCVAKNPKTSYSKISQNFFWKIFENIDGIVDRNEIYFGEHQTEFFNFCKVNRRIYFYDFCIRNLKFIIEFNGDSYHANPIKYLPSEIPKYCGNKLTALEIWERDKVKNNSIENLGFEILTIWEYDYKNFQTETINRVLEEIYARIEKNNKF